MSRRRITCPNALLFSFFLFSRLPEIRAETTIAVSATADDIAVNGNCTLREAIIAANTDSAVDGCPAGSGADTILLPAGVYMLALAGPGEDASRSGDLDVSGDVTIRGAGATATMILAKKLPLALSDRVIHVLDGGRLTLLGATIRGGVCGRGGGIFNAGQLFIEDCHIQGNQANEGGYCGPPGGGGAIFNQGDLTVTRSTISGNEALGSFGRFDVATPGGGVLNRGRAVIERSVLSGNYAAGGGGIWSQGDLHVADTQISSNGARFYAAALENYGSAMLTRVTISGNVDGGILNDGGPLILLNSTISGNTSFRIPGAVHNRSGPIEISSSTVAGNISVPDSAAGIGGSTQGIRLLNSIVANGGHGNCTGPVVSLGNNLDSDDSCGLTASGDLANADPLLGPLARNGGFTPTLALLAGSPAIDHIPAAQCGVPADQRGVVRPQPAWGGCDIGAYEALPTADVGSIIEDVKRLFQGRKITKQQELVMMELLKTALMAATIGSEQDACASLGEFAATVAGYVREGTMAPEAAGPLLEAAGRAMSIICP